jgi:hypothetical protein
LHGLDGLGPRFLVGVLSCLLLFPIGGLLWGTLFVCLLRNGSNQDYAPPVLLRGATWMFAALAVLAAICGNGLGVFALFLLPVLGPPFGLYIFKRATRNSRFVWQLALDFLGMASLALVAAILDWPEHQVREGSTELLDVHQPLAWICLLLVGALGILRLMGHTSAAAGLPGKLVRAAHWAAAILLPIVLLLGQVHLDTWKSLMKTARNSAFFN